MVVGAITGGGVVGVITTGGGVGVTGFGTGAGAGQSIDLKVSVDE